MFEIDLMDGKSKFHKCTLNNTQCSITFCEEASKSFSFKSSSNVGSKYPIKLLFAPIIKCWKASEYVLRSFNRNQINIRIFMYGISLFFLSLDLSRSIPKFLTTRFYLFWLEQLFQSYCKLVNERRL